MPKKFKPQLNREKHGLRWSARAALAVVVAGSFLCSYGIDLPSALASSAVEKKPKHDASLKNLPITELSADEAIQHALNRLAYGPRPGDVERIKQMEYEGYELEAAEVSWTRRFINYLKAHGKLGELATLCLRRGGLPRLRTSTVTGWS